MSLLLSAVIAAARRRGETPGGEGLPSPFLSAPSASETGEATAVGSASTTVATGVLYGYVSLSATAPDEGDLRDGVGAVAHASETVLASGVNVLSFSGLDPDTTYYVHFLHRRAGTNSNIVSSASFTTDVATGDIPFFGTETSDDADEILFQVTTLGSTGPFTTIHTIDAQGEGFTIDETIFGNAHSTHFWCRIMASNESGISSLGYEPFEFTTRPAAPPTGLIATAVGPDQVDLEWDSSDGWTRVFRNGVEIAALPDGDTSYSDIELAGSTDYTYTLKSFWPQVAYEGVTPPDQDSTDFSISASATTDAAPDFFAGYNEDLFDATLPAAWTAVPIEGGVFVPDQGGTLIFGDPCVGFNWGSGDPGFCGLLPPAHAAVNEAHYSFRITNHSPYGGQLVELTGICVIHIADSGILTARQPDDAYNGDRYNSAGAVIATSVGNLIGSWNYSLWVDVVMVDVGGTMKAHVTLLVGTNTTTKPTVLDDTNSFAFDSTMAVQPTGIEFHKHNGARLWLNRVRGAEFELGDAVDS